MWALVLSALALSLPTADVHPGSKLMGLAQLGAPSTSASDEEVTTVKDRIFDDQDEKNHFNKNQDKMDKLTSESVQYADRVKECEKTGGNCGAGMHLFAVWTTPVDGWNNKFTRSIDSALYHHPKARVTLYSSSVPLDYLDDFRKLGYDASVEPMNVKERAQDTPLLPWAEKLDQWKDGPFYYAHLSDAVRLLVLYKEGGVYFDTDVVFVKPVDSLKNCVGWERSDSLCNAFMVFDKGNGYIKDVLQEFNDKYIKDDWAANGPFLLTRIYDQHQASKPGAEVKAMDKAAFYMISWGDIDRYFQKSSETEVKHDMEVLKLGAYAVHFWNSRSHDLVVHPQSLMAHMFKNYCVFCNVLSQRRSTKSNKVAFVATY
jgi:hypothetical protein